MRGWPQRVLVGILGTVAIALLACPSPPNPGPNGPGGAGGSAPAPAPAPVTCQSACAHAHAVCGTVDASTCLALCPRLPAAFLARLAAATDCSGVKAADPGAPASQAGSPGPVGR